MQVSFLQKKIGRYISLKVQTDNLLKLNTFDIFLFFIQFDERSTHSLTKLKFSNFTSFKTFSYLQKLEIRIYINL